jgi:hypothetical protein
MAMEERHAANDWIGKIHHQIHRTAVGNINRVEPDRVFDRLSVDGVNQEVDLMNVKRMDFFGRNRKLNFATGTSLC